MRKLWCFEDRKGWGAALMAAARARGYGGGLFRDASPEIEGPVFIRLDQREPDLSHSRRMAEAALAAGARVVPDARMLAHYEDKWAQAAAFAPWMPATALIESRRAAEAAIGLLALPFVSKSKGGSASKNVRLIKSWRQADYEIEAVFGEPGGMAISGGLQAGYLIWQEFCAGNAYDYRLIINGRRYLMLRRYNRRERPFASGSGVAEPVNELAGEAAGAFEAGAEFFAANDMRWCGIDLVQQAGRWRVLETTIAWTLPAYAPCVYHGDPEKRHGSAQWEILLDELEAGIFG